MGTTNLGSNTSIAGRAGSDWRLTVGSNFGVTNTGKLYASGVQISGIGSRNLLYVKPKTYDATNYGPYQLNLTENLIAGQTYTLQLWDVVLDGNSTGLRPFWGGGSIALAPLKKPVNGYWSATFTITQAQVDHSSGNSQNEWINLYNMASGHSGMNCSIGKWKLEKGESPTDWSLAPEDGEESTGRNLLLRTRISRSLTASAAGGAYAVSPNLELSTYGQKLLNNINDYFTYSFDYEVTGNTADGAYIYVQAKGSQANKPSTHLVYVKNAASGTFTHTFHLNSAQVASTSIYCGILLKDASAGAKLTVTNMKLEKGKIKTDWSAAPEDMDVSKYITDISNNDGITIKAINGTADTNASSGNYLKLNPTDGLIIYKGGVGVAQFGSSVTVGAAGTTRVLITSGSSGGISIYDNGGNRRGVFTVNGVNLFGSGNDGWPRTTITAGATGLWWDEHNGIYADKDGLKFLKDNRNVGMCGVGYVRIGKVGSAGERNILTSDNTNSIQIRDNTTVLAEYGATITVGKTGVTEN
jgi:hypothetical protein